MTEKQKSFWNSIKDMVVEETPENRPPVAPSPAPTGPGAPRPTPVAPILQSFGTVDPAIQQVLETAIQKGAPQSYTEISDMISTLSDTIPDEGSRYRAALKLVAKKGHTLETVLGDTDACLGLLQTAGIKFEDEQKRQLNKRVGARQQAVQAMESQISQKEAQLTALQAEIAALGDQRNKELAVIEQESAEINAVRANFKSTYDAVERGLKERRQKLELFGRLVTT